MPLLVAAELTRTDNNYFSGLPANIYSFFAAEAMPISHARAEQIDVDLCFHSPDVGNLTDRMDVSRKEHFGIAR